ncbi:RNA-directed DNA polymerase [Tanacetum coccineum]
MMEIQKEHEQQHQHPPTNSTNYDALKRNPVGQKEEDGQLSLKLGGGLGSVEELITRVNIKMWSLDIFVMRVLVYERKEETKGKAMKWAFLEYWRHYLLPAEFILYSDHEALKFIQGQAKLKPRHAKWVETLQEFSLLSYEHKADQPTRWLYALSRRPALLSSTSFQVSGFAPFAHLYQDDPDFKELWDKFQLWVFFETFCAAG